MINLNQERKIIKNINYKKILKFIFYNGNKKKKLLNNLNYFLYFNYGIF
jgi:hypothetical protein